MQSAFDWHTVKYSRSELIFSLVELGECYLVSHLYATRNHCIIILSHASPIRKTGTDILQDGTTSTEVAKVVNVSGSYSSLSAVWISNRKNLNN